MRSAISFAICSFLVHSKCYNVLLWGAINFVVVVVVAFPNVSHNC